MFLSLFSGIEACSVAWKALGWECVGVAEVESFPCAVLAHHYPGVPNLGDVTKITDERIAALGPIDLVVGGSPCQDLSVAGKRAGLAGERSGLFHEQLRIFHAARHLCGARFLLWENVPGAFSSNGGRDFAVVVGSMAGCELDVPAEGWGNEGMALGEAGLVEWAVLDAQFFGVAQRRRRVFALLDTGDWAGRPPILLEPESLRGDSAPRREAGERPAPSIAARTRGGGGLGTDAELDGALIPETVGALTDGAHNGGGSTARTPTPAASSLLPEVAWCLQERDAKGADSDTKPGHLIPVIGGGFDVAHSLCGDGFDGSEDGTGRGTPLVQVTFAADDYKTGGFEHTDVARGLTTTADRTRGAPIVAIQNATRGKDQNGLGISEAGDPMYTLDGASQHAIAIQGAATRENPASGPGGVGVRADDTAYTIEARAEVQATMTPSMQVRRLTPRECERLQGFPDDYTLIPHRGKPAADGPRYKALGNSMAVPVMAWIGRQICSVIALKVRTKVAA